MAYCPPLLISKSVEDDVLRNAFLEIGADEDEPPIDRIEVVGDFKVIHLAQSFYLQCISKVFFIIEEQGHAVFWESERNGWLIDTEAPKNARQFEISYRDKGAKSTWDDESDDDSVEESEPIKVMKSIKLDVIPEIIPKAKAPVKAPVKTPIKAKKPTPPTTKPQKPKRKSLFSRLFFVPKPCL